MIHTISALRGCLLTAVTAVFLVACEGIETQPPPPATTGDYRDQRDREQFGQLFGSGPVFSLNTRRDRATGDGVGGAGIGVNAFIWRATLDTIDFIPLASADPFGGLIITDWYQSIDAPAERVKLHVQIRDATLRADALRVSVFRQQRIEAGDWLDAPVDETTARAIEDRILTRARELRVASTAAS